MTIEIHRAHGKAIQERNQLLRTILNQFQLLKMEDKRHVDAVLETLAQDPSSYENYDLRVDGEHYYLDLTPKQVPQPSQQIPINSETPQILNGGTQARV